MNEERIKEIFSDEAFVTQLFEQEEAEQVQALLAEKEIDLSVAEIVKLQEMLEKHANGNLDLEQLSDEDLEDVAGGSILAGIVLCVAGGLVVTVGAYAGLLAGINAAVRRRW